MKPNDLNQTGQITQNEASTPSAASQYTGPLSAYTSDVNADYILESLEVNDPNDPKPISPVQASGVANSSKHRTSLTQVTSKKAAIVSVVITLLVLAISALSLSFLLRQTPDQKQSTVAGPVPAQDIVIPGEPQIAQGLVGEAQSLLVNGDILTRGNLKVTSGDFYSVIQSQTLGQNQTVSLPNSSGVICLDSNNCGYVTEDQLAILQGQINGIQIPEIPEIPENGVTSLNNRDGDIIVQGTSSQINVSLAGDTITIGTPQNIATGSSPTFASLRLSGLANGFLQVNGTGNLSVGVIDLGTDTNGSYVASFTAGTGLTGDASGEGSTPTLNIVSANGGIVVNPDDIALTLQTNKGLEVDVNGLSLVDCADGEILKYETTGGTWQCDADAGGAGVGDDVLVNGSNADGANFLNTAASATTAGTTFSLNTAATPDEITLTISAASAVQAGIVTANAQTFGGDKTFSGQVIANGNITSTGALNITPGGALTVGSTTQTALLQGSSTSITSNGVGNDITLNSADAIILTAAGNITLSGFNCTANANGGKLTTDASGNITCAADIDTDTNTTYSAGNDLDLIGTTFNIESQLDFVTDIIRDGGNLTIGTTTSGNIVLNSAGTIELQDNTNVTGNLDVSGTLTSGTGNAFQVDASGNVTAGSFSGTAGTFSSNLQVNGGNIGIAADTDLIQLATNALTVNGTITSGLVNGQTITSTANFTGTLNVATSLTTPTLNLGVASTTSGAINLFNSGSVFAGSLNVAALAQATTFTLPDPGQATADICLSTGNCAGAGGGITGSGTINQVAYFDSGSTISSTGNFLYNGTDVTVNGILGLGTASTTTGNLRLFNSASAFAGTLQLASLGQATTYTLPDPGAGTADICLSTGNCAGAGGGITGSGTNGQVAFFDSGSTITSDSDFLFDGTDVTLGGDLAVNGGDITSTGALTVTPLAGTNLNVALSGAGDFAVNTNQLYVDTSTGNVGIGTSNPTDRLHVVTDGATSTIRNTVYSNVISERSVISLSRARGTLGTPSTVIDGDVIGRYTFNAYDGAGFLSRGIIEGVVNGAVSPGTTPIDIVFSTGGTSPSERLRISSSGNVGIGTDNPSSTLSVGTGSTNNFNVAGATGTVTTNGGYTQSGSVANTFTGASTFSAAGTGLAVTNNATVGGTINGQTITSAASLTGSLNVATTLAVQGASATIGGAAQQGSLILNDGNGQTATISIGSALVANTALAIPAGVGVTDTFCLQTLNNCSGVASTLQSAYEGGNTILATDAEGDIDLTVSEATNFSVDITGTGNFLVQDGGTTVLSIDATGDFLYQSSVDSVTGFQILDNDGGVPIFNVDTINGRVGIGTDSPSATLSVGTGSTNNFNVAGATGTVTTNGGYSQSGTVVNTFTGATTFSAAGTALTVTNNADIGGTLFVGTSDAFQVSAAGAVTAVGVNSGTGLIQGTGGLTLTGTADINATGAGTTNLGTGTGNTAIGNATGTLSLTSNGGLNVTTTGAVTGVSTLSTSGIITAGALGTASNDTVVCRNGSNELAACNSTFAGSTTYTLQGAYNNSSNPATITTSDAKNLVFNLADTTTDASLLVNLQGTGNTFAVQDGGSNFFTASDGANLAYVGNNAGQFSFTSSLTAANRSSALINITQANNASFNSSAALLAITQSDTASTGVGISVNQSSTASASALSITTASTTAALTIFTPAGGTGVAITGVTNGTAFNANTVTTGTALSATGVTSGNAVNVSGLTTGSALTVNISANAATNPKALNVVGAASSITADMSGYYINVVPSRTLATPSVFRNDNGGFLNLNRLNEVNGAGATFNILGALANFQSNCTQTNGSCTDQSNILNLAQNYVNATGTVFNVLGAGTGNLATLDTTNATANGVSIDVQSSSSSQYAFQVTTNNGTTNALYVRADGNVGIGTVSPSATLEVDGNVRITRDSSTPSTDFLQLYNPNQTAGSAGSEISFRALTDGTTNRELATIRALYTNLTDGSRAGDLIFSTATGAGPDERLRISSTGNVGIGTDSPSATLSVGTGSTNNFNVAGATGTVSTNGGYTQSGVIVNTFTGATTFSAAGTALTVTNNADIGGTLFVGTGDAFQVSSAGQLLFNNVATDITTGTNQDLTVIADGTGIIHLNDTVRIGALDCSASGNGGALTTDGSGNIICSDDEGGAGASAAGTAGAIQFSDGAGAFVADSTNFHWDDTNNRLGIGTNTPTTILDLIGANSNNYLFEGAANYSTSTPIASGAAIISLVGGNNTTGQDAAIHLRNEQTDADWAIYQDTSNGDKLIFASDTNPVLTLQSSNNYVGIGDTSPAAMFTVGNGDLFQVDSSGDITTAAGENLGISTGTTGSITIDTGTTGAINIGTGANAKTTTVGNTTGAAAVVINSGTGGVDIGDNATTKTTDIGGNDADGADTVRIATNATRADTITIGSTHASSIATLNGGGFNLNIRNTGVGINASAPTTGTVDLFFGNGSTRMINVNQASSGAGNGLTIQAGGGASGANAGGALLLQGGAQGTSGGSGSVIVRSNGTNTVTAFLIQQQDSTVLFTADTTNKLIKLGTGSPTITSAATGGLYVTNHVEIAGRLLVGTTTNGIDTNSGQARFTGTFRNDRSVSLKPEFEGAILRPDGGGDNTGVMTSGLCSGTSRLSINTTICAATIEHTYYEWTTSEGSAQDYDVYVRWRVPSDFDNGSLDTGSINMYGWRTDATNNSVQASMFNAAGSQCGATQEAAGTGGAWNTLSFSFATNNSNCDAINANDYVWFRFQMRADTGGDFVRLGEIEINYKSKF